MFEAAELIFQHFKARNLHGLQGVRLKYAFIKKHSTDYPVRRLCQTLKVHPSGYYAWLAEPQSARAKEDQRLLGLIKHAWLESGGVYGYRKIHDDLRELGEECGRNRVGRLMQTEGLRSQTGYRRRPGFYGGKPTVASPIAGTEVDQGTRQALAVYRQALRDIPETVDPAGVVWPQKP